MQAKAPGAATLRRSLRRQENISMVDSILKICGAISVVAAALAIIYKIYRYWNPAIVSISYTISALKDRPDLIAVTITNRSGAPIYIEVCRVRCTYSMLEIIKRHLRRPFLKPSLYPNLRYNGCVYELAEKEPMKLDPAQQVTLNEAICEHPLNAMYGPFLIAFVKLTTGRNVKSKKMPSPPVWRLIGRRGKTIA